MPRPIPTYHRGSRNFGSAWDMIERIEKLEANMAKAMEFLGEARDEIDAYIRQEYPLDHPVHDRYRQRDFAANPARVAMEELEKDGIEGENYGQAT